MNVLFDIGGTKLRVAYSKNGRKIERSFIFSVPKNFKEGFGLLKQEIAAISSLGRIKAIAGGLPGPLDSGKTKLIKAPHLPKWAGQPVATELKKIFKVPVWLENDTALVGLGEAVFGAGRQYDVIAYVTISTGVNGVRVVNKKIDKNIFGFEIGRQIIDKDDYASSRGQRGRLEDYISGAAIKKQFKKNAHEIKDRKFWHHLSHITALGVSNTLFYWSPEAVILGGAVAHSLSLPIIRKEVERATKIFSVVPPILKAELGDEGGLYGALAYLRGVSR